MYCCLGSIFNEGYLLKDLKEFRIWLCDLFLELISRGNISIEILYDWKKGLREKFYIKAYEHGLHIPDFKLIEEKFNG